MSEELFDACNKLLDNHKHKSRKMNKVNEYVLSGKLFCGHCYMPMTAETGTGKSGKVYRYYKCSARKKKVKLCDKTNVRQEYIENLIIEKTKEHILKDDVVNEIAIKVCKRFNSEISENATLINLQSQYKQISKNIESLVNALMSGITSSSVQEKLSVLQKEKQILQSKLEIEKHKQIKPLETPIIKQFIKQFKKDNFLDKQTRNEFFIKFINRVILNEDKILII